MRSLSRLNHLLWVYSLWWFPSLFLSSLSTGVIAVVIFIIFSIIGIMTRFLYQHKQSHRTNQMKEKEYPENLDSSFRNDIDLQNTVSECKREYFIWKTAGSPNILFWVVVKFFSFLLSFNFGHSPFPVCLPIIFGTYLYQPQHLSPWPSPEDQAAMATAFLSDKLIVVIMIT